MAITLSKACSWASCNSGGIAPISPSRIIIPLHIRIPGRLESGMEKSCCYLDAGNNNDENEIQYS